jgi:hypothetical protein
MKKTLSLFLLSLSFGLSAQQLQSWRAGAGQVSALGGTFMGFGIPVSDDTELLPELQHRVSKNESNLKQELAILKEEKMKEKEAWLRENGLPVPEQQESYKKTRTNAPSLITGYNALGNNGTPSDNTVAINKNDQIICSVNSSLRRYNATNGAALAATQSLASFFSTPQNGSLLTNSLCDPKVIWDQQAEKFIVFAQTCDGNSSTSQILLAFSKAADPAQGWYFYTFTGNPSAIIGQNVWFDYPKIAVSNSDVFVTGNLFNNSMNYVESVIYQINKTKCYAGQTLSNSDALLWSNLDNTPFTMVPLSNGQSGGYGNNMFLVSTENSPFGKFLAVYEINNSTANNPQITADLVATDTTASPADAIQMGTSVDLDLGDSRGMDGFYLNGTLHYVFHCDVGAGYSGINYSRLTKSGANWTLKRRIIKIAGKDLGFPAIASMGWNANDQSAIIGFNYASSSDFPGMKAVFVDNNMTASYPIEIKTGTGYASVVPSGGKTRWGDYSGMTRVMNATKPTAWHFGMFGNTSHGWTNHFAKISTNGWPLAMEEAAASENDVKVYPNPVSVDLFYAELDLPASGQLQVQLLDMKGSVVRKVFSGPAAAGNNVFSFNRGALPAGTYTLQFLLDQKPIQHEQLTVLRP